MALLRLFWILKRLFYVPMEMVHIFNQKPGVYYSVEKLAYPSQWRPSAAVPRIYFSVVWSYLSVASVRSLLCWVALQRFGDISITAYNAILKKRKVNQRNVCISIS